MQNNKLVLLVIIFLGFLFTSCKRNWVCECQTNSTVVPVDIINAQKEEAKIACDKYNFGIYAQSGGCKLK
jgi:hypothetical protein